MGEIISIAIISIIWFLVGYNLGRTNGYSRGIKEALKLYDEFFKENLCVLKGSQTGIYINSKEASHE